MNSNTPTLLSKKNIFLNLSVSLQDVVYYPSEKKLYLIFEFLDQDLKRYLDKNKHNLTPYMIKVRSPSFSPNI